MRSTLSCLTAISLLLVLSFCQILAQRFYPSDPMRVDNDQLVDVTQEPKELELSDLYDRFGHIFVDLGDPEFSEAQNVNTLDEVPDSGWFTNRHGQDRMNKEALARGANRDGPPSVKEEWYVFRGKSQGVTPGFQIEDSNGDRFVIKFDPVDVPELATAAESIASKIFYALGYNVPQNYVVHFNPDNLRIREGTMVADSFGDKVPLTPYRLKRMLRLVPRRPDGTVRAMASKYIEGKPIGPFRYYGTRSDDPNDVIPHEHRRELRGLRFFAAWTNHDDTRAQNTQDSWVERAGKHFIRHHLMDFGSTFGSGSVHIQLGYLGFSYSLDFEDMKYNAVRFGIPVPKYRRVRWPQFPEYQAVGRWEGDVFEPEEWKNDYPNPAFVRMTPRDAFWASKILMQFTPEELMAIVKTGKYSAPKDEQYFHEVLVKRQRKCGRFGINGLNPLDEFHVTRDALEFTNLSEKYGFVEPGTTSYQISWSRYDNFEEKTTQLLKELPIKEATRAELPLWSSVDADRNVLLLAEIRSMNKRLPHWMRPVRVYLRSMGTGYEVVAIERDSPSQAIKME